MKAFVDFQCQGAVIGPVSLELPAGLSVAEWQELGERIKQVERGALWWLGDWLAFGDRAFPEKADRYEMAVRITGLKRASLQNIRWVCGRVSADVRREELPFWAHSEIATLDRETQRAWLARAVSGGWGRDEFRRAIRGGGSPVSRLPRHDRVVLAAAAICVSARPVYGGGFIVPKGEMAELAAAIGRPVPLESDLLQRVRALLVPRLATR